MVIYFFKERSKELIDFYDLVDGYFDKCENTSITSNDNELIINLCFVKYQKQFLNF